MAKTGMSLRDMYRALELPGDNPLRKAHDDLDSAVRIAYGMSAREDALKFLMKLNDDVRRSESSMGRAQGPGLPARIKNKEVFVSDDRVVLSS
jgi:hypothetical protein